MCCQSYASLGTKASLTTLAARLGTRSYTTSSRLLNCGALYNKYQLPFRPSLLPAPVQKYTPAASSSSSSSSFSTPFPLFQQATFTTTRPASMKALVYKSAGVVGIEERPNPTIQSPTDAIVKLTHTTICGTDLHIIKGDVPTAQPGRVLGHEGVGVVQEVGSSVQGFVCGDAVLISCITACGACPACRKGMSSHCVSGGWILGNKIDGTQAEYVRIPHAASSLHKLPKTVDLQAAVMLSDALPTAMECGTLNGKVQPGSTVAVIGAGAVGMSVMMTAMLYSPALLVMVDVDDGRLAMAKNLGAHETVNSKDSKQAVDSLLKMTDGQGFDAVIEAVGIPHTFHLCQELVAPGGVIANVGVHGTKVELSLDKLWDRNICITTRLVDAVTTPMLLKLFQAGRLDTSKLTTHRFSFKECEEAYKVFGAAAQHNALKVLLSM
ncbi:alcohol dehydrogenase [Blastomyces dermatitidis ER-3]|uniref:Alcohol dehydrogenase n=1 Tax=Ajellomyces dermatitidis (strain ER-3 / ATCC MYA-2586) TaxID=559297 RepID=A0ABM9YIP0_AJEDR|nr:alcohol dehydrogenase [Blastomyces dermatitidis ER-3]EEQ91650.2 alcohol dehydrogenase [Blastomyces dermatitidis ER-3]